jgi:2-phosphoglycerate kinase
MPQRQISAGTISEIVVFVTAGGTQFVIMNRKPKCIIVTGRPGSGKNTLANKLARALWMPLVSRDEIKEGYVNTFCVKHDELPPDANLRATELFFGIVNQYLAGNISVVIEAAFQHHVWEPRMPKILDLASPFIILCSIDDAVAARRYLERGLADPNREYYHGDNMVVYYRNTGEILPYANYTPPKFDVPTIEASTDGEYVPSIDAIVKQIRSTEAHFPKEVN